MLEYQVPPGHVEQAVVWPAAAYSLAAQAVHDKPETSGDVLDWR